MTSQENDHAMAMFRDLAAGVRQIRDAFEQTFGPIELPPGYGDETPLRECEAIARAIYAAGKPSE